MSTVRSTDHVPVLIGESSVKVLHGQLPLLTRIVQEASPVVEAGQQSRQVNMHEVVGAPVIISVMHGCRQCIVNTIDIAPVIFMGIVVGLMVMMTINTQMIALALITVHSHHHFKQCLSRMWYQ